MTCGMALALVIACFTVCLKGSVGGSVLLVWVPGGKKSCLVKKQGYLSVSKKCFGQNKSTTKILK